MHVTLIGQFDPLGINTGGIEVHLSELNRHLKARGIDTLVLGWTHQRHGIKNFVSIVKSKKLTGMKYLVSLLLKAAFIHIPKNSIIHGHRPDHILPFIFRKNPILCTLHGAHIQNVKLKWGRLSEFIYFIVQSIVLKRVDFIIYVSESTRRFFIERHPFLANKEYAIISPGVQNIFQPSEKKLAVADWDFQVQNNGHVLIYVGRLEKEKNVDRLIELVKGTCFQLLIVGEGREGKRLKQTSRGCSNIVFLDRVSHEKVPSLINTADACVLFSEYEGMPTFVLEGLACGKPVLSTDVGDVCKLISSEKTGCIVTESNFIKCAENLLSDNQNRFRQNCVVAIHEHRWDRVADRIVESYRSLENGKPH